MSSILVTGGTGSFGQAFVRHLLDDQNHERICIYSRGEHSQAAMREMLRDNSRLRWFIGDVRDRDRLRRAVTGCDVVVHAAALKRIEVCEYNAGEVVSTNVLGTRNVIESAIDRGVKKVVVLSSDKACAPINAYGASKLMAEKLTLATNNSRGADGPIFACTRYGNVAGSQGSVIPVWRRPGPHWMSDPDSTRFWMTLAQACQLVSWTLEHMSGSDIVVPDLPAYRLGDLAVAMSVNPKITGYRGAEKPHEAMISEHEFQNFQHPCWTADGSEYWISRPWVTMDLSGTRIGPLTSDRARKMTVNELKVELQDV